MNDLKAELRSLVHDERAFLAACQGAMGLQDRDMHLFFSNLTSKWGQGGEDVELAKTFLRFLTNIDVNIQDLVFSHPRWKTDLLLLCKGTKGAAWYGTMNNYCRSLLRHLSGKDIKTVEHPYPRELTDEEIRAMSKVEFFDFILFGDFPGYLDRSGMKLVRGEYWGDGYGFQLYRFPSGSFGRYISNSPG